ncbi:hypothetical protein J6590_059665 [Homalodisca vitripennis]|nr:hypothetical protein J6590_059665 [Homalodisca vitripennis]
MKMTSKCSPPSLKNRRENTIASCKPQKRVLITYTCLCEGVICHILTLSRRRPAEATRALVYHYQARGNHNYASSSILASLSEQERESYSALNFFLVPGLKTPGFMTTTGLRHQLETEAQVHGEKFVG